MAFERQRNDSPKRRGSMVSERSWADDEQQPLIAEPLKAEDEVPASWLTLPKKGQLFTLAMCRYVCALSTVSSRTDHIVA